MRKRKNVAETEGNVAETEENLAETGQNLAETRENEHFHSGRSAINRLGVLVSKKNGQKAARFVS